LAPALTGHAHTNTPDLQFNAGTAAYKAGQFPQAAEAFQKSLGSEPFRLGFLLRIAKRRWLIFCFETIRDLNYFWFHFLKLAGNLRNVRDLSLVKNGRDLKRYCWFLQDKEIDILKINRVVPHHFGQDEVYRGRSIKAKVPEIH
jgi:hypothetical protein